MSVDDNDATQTAVNPDAATATAPPPPPKRKRATRPPTALENYLVTSTLGQREAHETESDTVLTETVSTATGDTDTAERVRHTPGYRHQHLFYPVLDTLIKELDRRFTGEAIQLAQACAAVFTCDKKGIEPLLEKYAQPLKIHPILVGSEMDVVKASCDTGVVSLDHLRKTVTKEGYPNLYKMLQLALTLPIGSATTERSFSAMRRIRNWLRSTMGAKRFSSLSILNIEDDLTAKLSPEKIVDIYDGRKTRRLLLH